MVVALGSLQVVRGTKVSLFNRGRPKAKAITAKDVKFLRSQLGEIVCGRWYTVVCGVAYVVSIDSSSIEGEV
jgi:hypothetical protein